VQRYGHDAIDGHFSERDARRTQRTEHPCGPQIAVEFQGTQILIDRRLVGEQRTCLAVTIAACGQPWQGCQTGFAQINRPEIAPATAVHAACAHVEKGPAPSEGQFGAAATQPVRNVYACCRPLAFLQVDNLPAVADHSARRPVRLPGNRVGRHGPKPA
jgi:hypothetical protein